MQTQRIYSAAQVLLQISLTVLPIGAGAASYISQQEQALPVLVSITSIFLGLVMVAVSLVLSLGTLKTPEPTTSDERRKLETGFRASVTTFIVGTILFLISPIGFAINQFVTPNKLDLSPSSNIIEVPIRNSQPGEKSLVVTAYDISLEEYPSLNIEANISDTTCLMISKINEQPPVFDQDTWVTVWKVTAQATCVAGDHAIAFKVQSNNKLRGQTQLTVRVIP